VTPGERPTGRWRADLALVAAAFLFGVTFVIVQEGVEDAAPLPFLAVRFLIGLVVLVPFAAGRPRTPQLWRDGGVAGLALGAGYVFQTTGLQYTTPSVSAFITYMAVVFLPVIVTIAFRRPPQPSTVVGVVIAVVGLVLLTGGVGGEFGRGEWLTLGCAFCFAVHIVILARVAPRNDTIALTAVQIAVVMVGCGVAGWFTGGYGLGAAAWAAALVTGIGATAVAFLLQTGAQKVVSPTRAVLVLLLEPVFAALLGAVLGERLGWRGVLGGVLILAAVIVVEVVPQLRGSDVPAARAAAPESP
jgi:drug/metabolite transporter (DMT)-like permease